MSRFWRRLPSLEHFKPHWPAFLSRSEKTPPPAAEYYVREAEQLNQKFALFFPDDRPVDIDHIDGLAVQLRAWLEAFQALLKSCRSDKSVYQSCREILTSHQSTINWFIDNYRNLVEKSSIGSTQLQRSLLILRQTLPFLADHQTR